jgi:tRNA-dihydrouridine synthase B
MHKQYWKAIKKPILALAPMEGYSDSAFRRTCKQVNPHIITYTEFTSADGIHFNAQSIKRKLEFHLSEKPVIAQIFGKNIETFVTATKFCTDLGFTGIDINMGCPSKKVVRSEHGVALRKKPDLAYKLIEACAKATHLPISIKTRLGWSDAGDLTSFCVGAEQAGANMICVHARTYQNPYKVPAQWEHLYETKKHLTIPLIGNGGITSLKDGLEKCKNLDGIMIGQATFGNPWIFDTNEKALTLKDKLPVIKKHAEWLIESKGEQVGSREIRKHLLKYVKGFRQAKQFRSKLSQVNCYAEIENILDLMLVTEEQQLIETV